MVLIELGIFESSCYAKVNKKSSWPMKFVVTVINILHIDWLSIMLPRTRLVYCQIP